MNDRTTDPQQFQADLAATAIAAKGLTDLWALSQDRDRLMTGLRNAHTDSRAASYPLSAMIACNLAQRCVLHMFDHMPNGSAASLAIVDDDGNPINPDTAGVDPCFTARIRILTAMLNRDVYAAMDVFLAFDAVHPDRVPDLLADLVEQAHNTIEKYGSG